MIDIKRAAQNVADVFKANDWVWYDSPDPPGPRRVQRMIEELLADAAEPDVTQVRSGRLAVINEFSDENDTPTKTRTGTRLVLELGTEHYPEREY